MAAVNGTFEAVWPGNTTPQQVCVGPGHVLKGYSLLNNASTQRYVRIFDSVASPTMGTDTAKIVIALPAGAAGAGANLSFDTPIAFAFGIWVSVTTGVSNTDNSAPSASDVLLNLFAE